MKDSKGDEIEIGDFVIVPEPNDSDFHNYEFEGRVVSFHNEFVVVEDMDGDSYNIEPERLTIS